MQTKRQPKFQVRAYLFCGQPNHSLRNANKFLPPPQKNDAAPHPTPNPPHPTPPVITTMMSQHIYHILFQCLVTKQAPIPTVLQCRFTAKPKRVFGLVISHLKLVSSHNRNTVFFWKLCSGGQGGSQIHCFKASF